MKKIRILISDDHNLIRLGLINLLENDPDLFIVGEAEDGIDMIEKYKETLPDIVLSDISMPELNGIVAAQKILSFDPLAKIIFLTVFNIDNYIYKVIKIGAYGLVSKQVIKGELVNAIKSVMRGEVYFSGKTEKEIKEIKNSIFEKPVISDSSKISLLNENELEVLLMISDGLSSEEIANKMSVSKKVVDHLRVLIMEKLDLKSLPQLIKYSVEYTFKKKQKP